jgi:hypothetical protein
VCFVKEEILKQLDEHYKIEKFPSFLGDEDYVFHINTRMNLFASEKTWSLVIQHINYMPRAGDINGVNNTVYLFGNNIDFDKVSEMPVWLPLLNASPNLHAFPETYYEIFPPEITHVMVAKKNIKIERDFDTYEKIGITLDNKEEIHISEFMRYVSHHHSRILFLTAAELAQYFLDTVPEILTLNEWYQPLDFYEHKPSEIETFQQVAEVLVEQDKNCYKPTYEPTTHWTNWV